MWQFSLLLCEMGWQGEYFQISHLNSNLIFQICCILLKDWGHLSFPFWGKKQSSCAWWFFFFPPSVTEFWKLTDVDNELCVLHEGQFLIALGLVSVTSKKGKVNEENSLGNYHVSAHSTQNKDAELK